MIDPVLGTNEEKSTVAEEEVEPSTVPLAEANVPSENSARKGKGASTVIVRLEYEKDNEGAEISPGVCKFSVMSSKESRVSVSALLSTPWSMNSSELKFASFICTPHNSYIHYAMRGVLVQTFNSTCCFQ